MGVGIGGGYVVRVGWVVLIVTVKHSDCGYDSCSNWVGCEGAV